MPVLGDSTTWLPKQLPSWRGWHRPNCIRSPKFWFSSESNADSWLQEASTTQTIQLEEEVDNMITGCNMGRLTGCPLPLNNHQCNEWIDDQNHTFSRKYFSPSVRVHYSFIHSCRCRCPGKTCPCSPSPWSSLPSSRPWWAASSPPWSSMWPQGEFTIDHKMIRSLSLRIISLLLHPITWSGWEILSSLSFLTSATSKCQSSQ